MNADRTRQLTPLVAIAAAALLAGCTSGPSNTDATLPPGATPSDTPTSTNSPTPTPTPNSTPSPTSDDTPMPTNDELVELVNAYRNITLDLPTIPVDQAQQHINQAAANLTTPDGIAREALEGAIGETGQIVRGRPYTAIVGQPQPDGPEWTATGCVATRGQTTQIETGEPTESDPFTSEYNEADLRVSPNDNSGWLLVDYDQPDDPQDLVRCAPPEVVDAVRTNWQQTNELATEWTAGGQPAELLEPLKPLMTRSSYESLQDMVGSGTITRDSAVEIEYGFEVISVRPQTDAIAQWCQDATRDPTARSTNNETGEVTDLSEQEAAIVTAEWKYVDGGWRRGASTGSRVAQEGEAPCE